MSNSITRALASNQGLGLVVGGVLVAGLVWWLFGDKLKRVVTEKLNPASDQNVVYDDIIGGVGRAVSDDPNWSLGSWIYDVFNKDANLAGNPTPHGR